MGSTYKCTGQCNSKYTCNVVPAHIEYTGYVAGGSTRWRNQLEEKDNKQVNYLRGRRLVGSPCEVQNYSVVLMKEEDDGIGGLSDEKKYEKQAEIDEVVTFGHDAAPEKEKDAVHRLKEWVELSDAIHG